MNPFRTGNYEMKRIWLPETCRPHRSSCHSDNAHDLGRKRPWAGSKAESKASGGVGRGGEPVTAVREPSAEPRWKFPEEG